MKSRLYEPQYWRQRAEEVRKLGAELQEPNAHDTIIRIALEYERLAEIVRHLPSPLVIETSPTFEPTPYQNTHT